MNIPGITAARALLLALALAFPAHAVEPAEKLANPALEARARQVSQGLRCLVCQNESIDESHADLAHDVRVLLRERITAGDTDAQATAYIVARYGEFVLLEPPMKRSTYLLWFSPVLLLAAAAAAVALAARHKSTPPAPPLDAAERQRLAQLLQESEP